MSRDDDLQCQRKLMSDSVTMEGDSEVRSADSGTFLIAARRGATSAVDQGLREDPSLLLAADEEGNTALHLASLGAHDQVVSLLLKVSDDN